MLIEAPVALRCSIRLLISAAASQGMSARARDVTQACAQSLEDSLRDARLKPPKELEIGEGKVIKLIKPAPGIAESDAYWWLAMLGCHAKALRMKQAALDPCLLCKRENGALQGMQAALVDGALGAGSESFALLEEQKSKRLKVKPRKEGHKLKFAGSKLNLCERGS